MKVCTDACLFGAWVANDAYITNAASILDIGTGTGLLSLMLAQSIAKNDSLKHGSTKISAIEIEYNAAAEASRNTELSPWSEKIQIINSSIQDFAASYQEDQNNFNKQFDCIISNPPFFEGDLQSPNSNKNLAAHSTALPWSDLLNIVGKLLKSEGAFYVLIPALRAYTMQKLANQNGIQLMEEVVVYNAAKQKPFRVFQKFIKSSSPLTKIMRSNFIIKNADNSYTEAFTNLLKPYYLHL